MKKFFSLLMMAVLTTAAWAGTVTFDLTTGYTNGEEVSTIEKDGVTLTFDKGTNSNTPKWFNTGTAVRLYGGGTLTVSADANITKIEFTITQNDQLSTETGTYEDGVWTGEATSVLFTQGGTTGHVRIQGITVTIDAEVQGVATPVITLDPAEGPYYEGDEVNVSITCATEGATIYYALNDGDWTEGDNFDITETTTIKAKAVLDETESDVATTTVTFVPAATTASTVAEFNALQDNTSLTFNGTLTVLGQTGKYLYAQDANNGILIYGTIDQTYAFGDQIPAGFTGTKTTYKGAPEMTNPAGLAAATSNVTPVAIEMTIDDVTLANFGRYGVIRGATYENNTLTVGEQTIATYNRFGLTLPTDASKVYDVFGIVSYFDGEQFLPLEFVDVTPAEEMTITFDPAGGEFNEPVTVTLTCNTPGALITYAINNGDDVDYTEPFTLYESATVTAFATDGDQLVEASATYTITLPAITATFTPAAGTYYTAQNVKVAIENTYGETAVAYYVNGEEVEYDAENGIAVTESATIKVEVMDEYHSEVAEFTAEYVIATPDPLPASGTATIVFGDNESDSNAVMTSDEIIAYITEGAQYVADVTDIAKVYMGATGIKFSSSKDNGTMTLNFVEAFPNVKSVEVEAENWHNATSGKYDVASLNEVALADSMATYTIAENLEEPLASLTLTATKRAYVKSITITWGSEEPAVMGDLNGDKLVDVVDINLLINAILNDGDAAGIVGNPDLTGDNNIDVEDINVLVNIILAQ
ncbi:MAG: chitobiase/beta-hexosaminidase C-terminal domain-containing protein [Muribaculaceae bacterium]|nr:chitobiase/beta-hexosaminidase C-terminal domain-containing protein [Muribaculaceae bacterium]